MYKLYLGSPHMPFSTGGSSKVQSIHLLFHTDHQKLRICLSQRLTEQTRRDSGAASKGRPALSNRRRRVQNQEHGAPEPAEKDPQPRLTPSDSPSHRIRIESQTQTPPFIEEPHVICDAQIQLGPQEYPEIPSSPLQTPPDSTIDGFLFESNSICELSFLLISNAPVLNVPR
jgi:hypothetical protein